MKLGRLIWKQLSSRLQEHTRIYFNVQCRWYTGKCNLLAFFKLNTLDSELDEYISNVETWNYLGEKLVQRQKIGVLKKVMAMTTSENII